MSLVCLAVVLSITPCQAPGGLDTGRPKFNIALPGGVDMLRRSPVLHEVCIVGGCAERTLSACLSDGMGAERALLLLGPPARAALCLNSGFADYPADRLRVSFPSDEQARTTANLLNGIGSEHRVPLPGDPPRPPWQTIKKEGLPLVGRLLATVIREGMTVAQVQSIIGRPAACIDTPASRTDLYPRFRVTVMYRTQDGQSIVEHVFWCGFPG